MARIELRDAYVYISDGLAGTMAVNNGAGYAIGATTMLVKTVVTNLTDTDLIPVGATFTIDSGDGTVYTVSATVPGGTTSPTTSVTFTPALTEAVSDSDPLTIGPQRVLIKVGEGNVTWTESKEYNYYLDRGDLDTVAEGDQQPVEVSIDMTYEHVTTGTSEDISPVDALKQIGGASDWLTAASDSCEPYATTITIYHITPCGTAQDEKIIFTPFRWDSLDFDLSEATISMTGRANAVSPTVSRGDYDSGNTG